MYCDFCGSPTESTQLREVNAPPISMLVLDGENIIGEADSPDNWLACPACHIRIINKDYESIINDVVCQSPDPRFRIEMHDILLKCYKEMSVLQ